MSPRTTVVLATTNRGKLSELRALLSDLPIQLVAVSDVTPHPVEVVEDGATFEENARKKARAVARALALPALADDSGLEVDLLDGRPGVRSARFAGEQTSDSANNQLLLSQLSSMDAPDHSRTARFRCVLCLVDPIHPDEELEATGACEGLIAHSPRGTGGFGYDPIFVVREIAGNRTMAELSDVEKNALSHRSRAVAALREQLVLWLSR